MDTSIEKIIIELVFKVANHFKLENDEALGIVSQSTIANELCEHGNIHNLTIEQICNNLYEEIARGECFHG